MNNRSGRTLVSAVGIALGITLLPGTGWAESADAMKPVAESVTVNAGPKVLAGRILSRWAPIAEAAGMDMALWHEQYSMQFSAMSTAALRIMESVAPATGAAASANYARFVEAFRSAMMQTYASGGLDKTEAKLGATDAVFVAIPPCRVADTRNVGGPISAGNTANFYFFTQSAGFSWASQGGVNYPGALPASTTCPGTINPNGGILYGAVISISVVAPTAAGNWIIWGGANPIPPSASLLWQAGQNLTATTIVPYGGRSGVGPGGLILDFGVYYNGPSGSAHFVADVVGYFVENKATALDCVTVPGTGTSCAAFTYCSDPAPACTAGYTRTGTYCYTSGTAFYLTDVREDICFGTNSSGISQTITARSRCCRVPGQ